MLSYTDPVKDDADPLDDPDLRASVFAVLAATDVRTFLPVLGREIAGIAVLFLRSVVHQPAYANVRHDDMIALADYLEIGPNERIPDDETALAIIASINVALEPTKPRPDA